MSIEIQPQWRLKRRDGEEVSLALLLQLLSSIRDLGNIGSAAAQANLSYRHAWGLLRSFEQVFSAPLLEKSRGKGTTLTPLAEKLIWADKRITARLTPILESFASELESILSSAPAALRITASHGFAVEQLIKRLNTDDVPVEINYRNRLEAVTALARGECDLAGFHVPVGEFEMATKSCLKWLDPKEHSLIHLAYRTQGLFIAKGNPKQIEGLADLTRNDVRFINRQEGSGTKMLLELLLAKANIDPRDIPDYDHAEFTHAAIAAFVASKMADIGFGVETAARRFDLDFIPLAKENYFFACKTSNLPHAIIKLAREIMQEEAFRTAVNTLPGYDGSQSGALVAFEEIFH
ncbi:LysR family transcriptional regulator [Halothiobacillus diazotrophicus]|uniref:LysR family transcriptional regulator n=1 Tax=Halothiobacillus diazotrophicus TaxID=1860122 RepID=A0A191ZEN7_9GAMM|nr:substrate-binding domain-containing protein [Halothiobacillus diazotrophicus]ANJ66341.1 LysR family transcriptional regulator [Halothiobacillus diazotrophicus]